VFTQLVVLQGEDNPVV